MKKLLAVAAMLAALFVPSVAAQEKVSSAVIEKAAFSVVAIMDTQKNIFCSGFVIDTKNGYVLLADHCLSEGLQYYDAALVDGAEAVEICHDPNRDLSVLKTKTEKPALTPRFEPLALGEPVVGLGFAGGESLAARFGTVQKLDFFMYDQTWLLTGVGEPGMSGGPILDAAGKVVGMVQMLVPGHPEMDFGNSVSDLLDFVETCGLYSPSGPPVGIADRVA